MSLSDLEALSAKQLHRLKKQNAFSFHAFMIISLVFMTKAVLFLNPLVLILSIGFIITAHTFYSNLRTIKNVDQLRKQP